MAKLNRKVLRKLILKEFQKMEEDSLRQFHDAGDDHRSANHTQCTECGSLMYEEDNICEACGHKHELSSINESDCGCGTCELCGSSMSHDPGNYKVLDYDRDDTDHLENQSGSLFSIDQDDDFIPDEALSAGLVSNKHHDSSYMAKSHLHKTAKYAQKLYDIVPDNLEDWMRSKLAQIADDIGEVYHALDHDSHESD
jgi:hypothetical protein